MRTERRDRKKLRACVPPQCWNLCEHTYTPRFFFLVGICITFSHTPTLSVPFSLPFFFFSPAGTFPGDLDEIRFWKVARSQAEILRDMHRSLVGTTLVSKMLFYYPMDTPSTTTVADVTGNGYDATLGMAIDGTTFSNQERRKPIFRSSSAPISGSPIVKSLVAPTPVSPMSVMFRLNDTAAASVPGGSSLFVTFLALNNQLSVQSVSFDSAGAATQTDIVVSMCVGVRVGVPGCVCVFICLR